MENLLAPDLLGKIIQTIGAIIVAIIAKPRITEVTSRGKSEDKEQPSDEEEPRPNPPIYLEWIITGVVAAITFGILGLAYDAFTPEPTCEFNNLLACRDELVPITQGPSRLDVITSSAQTVIFDFDNDQSYSGIAFKFSPALKVRGFTHLEISGTSTEAFEFVVEYKVRKGETVARSDYKLFSPTNPQTIRVPMEYDDIVNEIALVFYVKGEASQVTIESIRFSE